MAPKVDKNIDTYAFLVLFASIIYILFYNLTHYDQLFGYDGEAHHGYVQNFLNIFIYNNDLPPSDFTREFFSPPLPYVFPTFINEVCKRYFNLPDIYESCRQIYSFSNIFFQSLLYLLTIYFYLKTMQLFFNKKNISNLSTLLLIGIFSVNYKTVVMLRGEIYILFFNSLLMFLFLKFIKKSFNYKKLDIFLFGLIIGFLALSRQWAFLLFPGYILLLLFLKKDFRKKYFSFMFYSSMIGFLISSWFYFNLYFQYGTFTAFNLDPVKFSFYNQPKSFYIPSLESLLQLFDKPIRPNFDNQFLPILYSDLWGDYWGYFSFTSRDLSSGRNQEFIGSYLGRVNTFSLFPTFFYLSILIYSIKTLFKKQKNLEYYFIVYLVFSIISSFVGYFLFLVSYPVETGDTNKASYIIQMFHMLGLLSVIYLEKVKDKSFSFYLVIVSIFTIVFIHNFSAMLSHFEQIKFNVF